MVERAAAGSAWAEGAALMSTAIEAFFAQSYAEARQKFFAAAARGGYGDPQARFHPLRGRDGELLAMDVLRVGPRNARSLLIVSSGCHGAEGFCGSGVQGALLADRDFERACRAAGVAVLYIHALNPYGFSWLRRTTHENVDLNRNFQDFNRPLPVNAAYDALAAAAVPETWPPGAGNEAAIAAFVQQHGPAALQAALSGGQYSHPNGLFFGGTSPTWSHVTLRRVLRDEAQNCRRLAWIDLHTGLGPSGHGEKIFACRDDADALARAKAWWGPEVTSIYDGSSSSALLTGLMWNVVYEEVRQAEYTGIALEYGTLPQAEVIAALRADQWLENHPDAPAEQRAQIKRQLRDAFYTDTPLWKAQIVEQGLAAARQAVAGLSRRG
jgi:hypothetical protein